MQISRQEIRTALWCSIAAFGAYCSMYAFRKPFAAASFSGLSFAGIDYKVILVVSQLFGYLISKFLGIKVISELKKAGRIRFLLQLILIAECCLLGFALSPYPYNFIWLFLNGIPLGMVFGVVFSFLEGRRLTELMSLGLSTSIIFASGFTKSVGKTLLDDFHVSHWWMPVLSGLLFMPLLVLSVWMLSQIPAPSKEDMEARMERKAMSGPERKALFSRFAPGLILLVIAYIMLTTFRDLRDNFAIEIWTALGFPGNAGILASSELMVSLLILLAVGGLSFLKNNMLAFRLALLAIVGGSVILGLSTFLFQHNSLTPTSWMILSGFGLFLAYTVFQGILFERMIAAFREKGNVGFLMYLADAFGYLGSAGVLIFHNFSRSKLDWLPFFIFSAYCFAGITALLGTVALLYFNIKSRNLSTVVILV